MRDHLFAVHAVYYVVTTSTFARHSTKKVYYYNAGIAQFSCMNLVQELFWASYQWKSHLMRRRIHQIRQSEVSKIRKLFYYVGQGAFHKTRAEL